ncbi:MAG TPA: hypothetical protein DCQ15_04575 [Chitinophagaceae bacterium]|nr:hypothetical protein [Chitinophagaceae bacterium]
MGFSRFFPKGRILNFKLANKIYFLLRIFKDSSFYLCIVIVAITLFLRPQVARLIFSLFILLTNIISFIYF